MHPLLDNYLCKKYPKIFVNRNKSPKETCMCWGFPGDGWFYIIDSLCHNIQHWCDNPEYVEKKDVVTRFKNFWNRYVWSYCIYPLVHKLPYEEYQRYSQIWQFHHDTYEPPKENPRQQLTADQVKEKFSGLRFYYSGGWDKSIGGRNGGEYIRGLVSMAESMSYHTCEDCGRTDDEVVATTGWIVTVCPKCNREGRPTQPRNSADPELAKIWKQVHQDNEKEKKRIEACIRKDKAQSKRQKKDTGS